MSVKDLWQAAAASGNREAQAFLAARMGDIEEAWRAASEVVFAEDETDPLAAPPEEAPFAIEFEREDVQHILESLEQSGNPLEYAERQRSLFRALAAAYPDRYLGLLVKWLGIFSEALAAEDRAAEAFDCITEAIQRAREASESGPGKWMGLLLRTRGLVLLALDRPQEALASYREALESASLDDKNLANFRREFTGLLEMVGMELLQAGHNTEALPYLEERTEVLRQMVLCDGSKWPDLATALSNLGVAGFDSAPEAAQAALAECAQVRRVLAASEPDTYLPLLAIALNNLGEFCRQHGDLENGRAHLAEAVAIRRPLAMSDPTRYGLLLIRSLNNLLLVLRAMADTGELLSRTTEICETLLELARADAEFARDYVNSLLDFADVRITARCELAEALENVQLALMLCDRLPPSDITLNRALTLREKILAIVGPSHSKPQS